MTRSAPATRAASCATSCAERGYGVVPDLFSANELERWRGRLDEVVFPGPDVASVHSGERLA